MRTSTSRPLTEPPCTGMARSGSRVWLLPSQRRPLQARLARSTRQGAARPSTRPNSTRSRRTRRTRGMPGQYVTVAGQNYYWDGTNWLAGVTPLPPLSTGVTPGAPGAFTPGAPTHRDPADQIELFTIPGGVVWSTPGDYVTVAGTQYWWDGSNWLSGVVPTPVATDATPGQPGQFTPALPSHRPPNDLAELAQRQRWSTAWTNPGDYVDIAGSRLLLERCDVVHRQGSGTSRDRRHSLAADPVAVHPDSPHRADSTPTRQHRRWPDLVAPRRLRRHV